MYQSEVRDIVIDRLVKDIYGPRDEEECLPKNRNPKDEYMTGILYPQETDLEQDETDQLAEESAAKDVNDSGLNENLNSSRTWLPSSMGLSFAVFSRDKKPKLNIDINCGVYRYVVEKQKESKHVKSDNLDRGIENENACWIRKPLHSRNIQIQLVNEKLFFPKNLEDYGIQGMRLHVKHKQSDNIFQFTVTLINKNIDSGNLDYIARTEACYFQTELKVSVAGQSKFISRSSNASGKHESDLLNSMLYRNIRTYASGHMCSATWDESQASPEYVTSCWIPMQMVHDVSAEGNPKLENRVQQLSDKGFSAMYLSDADDHDLLRLLSTIPEVYDEWVQEQAGLGESEIGENHTDLFNNQVSLANQAISRMKMSIQCLKENSDAMKAFRLANKSMALQAEWQGYELIWRPFQLGFALLTLNSLVNRNVDRNIMDLLWFPTGGGKTEAYLLLMAFVMFHRRYELGGLDVDDGVAVITRYTLRALTTDQFARTVAMVCSCEIVRRGLSDQDNTPFSLGLWIGSSATPNSFQEAVSALSSNAGATPVVLDTCPCCEDKLEWEADHHAEQIYASCTNSSCDIGKNIGRLPIHTIDEQIYRIRPTIVIGTVDKFAQVVRFPSKTDYLFNRDQKYPPPDLIVQDELHLISGPLGTMTGLMEIAIDDLCSNNVHIPKIIGSTATIQRASEQVSGLFNRDVFQFPTPVLNADDSFFSHKNKSSTGRLYLGITTAGRTPTFMLQGACGSLLQSVMDSRLDTCSESVDPYTTLTVYFNSLRILGGARTLLWEDAQKSKSVYASLWGEQDRAVKALQELTSIITQEELKQTLSSLKRGFSNEDHIDMLLASVMLSVGVNITRLGLMIVDGQPKTMAEYIQATSRIGRGEIPGLIITIYNNSKTRDRSHYETFKSWHMAFYRHVESSSITPFAPRARDKGLKALVAALATRNTGICESDATLTKQRRSDIEKYIKPKILARVDSIDSGESKACNQEIDLFLDEWEAKGNLSFLWNDYKPEQSLFVSAEKAAKDGALGKKSCAWSAPNSMRDVEPDVNIKVRDNRL